MPNAVSLDFIEHAQSLDAHGQFDASLDVIYNSFDDLFRHERWTVADRILGRIDISVLSVDVMIGVLTATLPAAERLDCRGVLFAEIEEVLAARGELDDGLLAGLE